MFQPGVPGTPAARFGLKPGDVITRSMARRMHDSDGLVLNVGKLPADAVTRLACGAAASGTVASS